MREFTICVLCHHTLAECPQINIIFPTNKTTASTDLKYEVPSIIWSEIESCKWNYLKENLHNLIIQYRRQGIWGYPENLVYYNLTDPSAIDYQ